MKTFYTNLLKRAAKRWIHKYQPYVIGVTGSMGKTTCRMMVHEVLVKTTTGVRISTSEKNFNSEIGIVLAIFEIGSFSPSPVKSLFTLLHVLWKALFSQPTYDILVLEYGIDTPGDMDVLVDIVPPHMSIFTGIDKVHAEYFEDIDEILEEKMKLMQASKEITFLPNSASYAELYAKELSIDVLRYAQHQNEQADIGFSHHVLSRDGDEVIANFSLDQQVDRVGHVLTSALGQAQAGYISLGVEIAMILGRRIGACEYTRPGDALFVGTIQQAGRASFFPGKYGSMLIDSSYNAAPKSMQHMIDLAIRLRKEVFQDHDLIYCLGDMRELGDFAPEEHKALAAKLAHSADGLYLIGEHMTNDLNQELSSLGYNMNQVKTFVSSRELGKAVLADIAERDRLSLVLRKGSQNTIFLEEGLQQVLKNPEDSKQLPRQETRWKKKKDDFFNSL